MDGSLWPDVWTCGVESAVGHGRCTDWMRRLAPRREPVKWDEGRAVVIITRSEWKLVRALHRHGATALGPSLPSSTPSTPDRRPQEAASTVPSVRDLGNAHCALRRRRESGTPTRPTGGMASVMSRYQVVISLPVCRKQR